MKKTVLFLVLTLMLVFAFSASALADFEATVNGVRGTYQNMGEQSMLLVLPLTSRLRCMAMLLVVLMSETAAARSRRI